MSTNKFNFELVNFYGSEVKGNSNMADYVRHNVDVSGEIILGGVEYVVTMQTGHGFYGNDYSLPTRELEFYSEHDGEVIEFLTRYNADEIDWEEPEYNALEIPKAIGNEESFKKYKSALGELLEAANKWFEEYVKESDEMSNDPSDYLEPKECGEPWELKTQ